MPDITYLRRYLGDLSTLENPESVLTIKSYKLTLTNAQIKTLFTDSPIILVPEVLGKIILPVLIQSKLNWNANYTNINPDYRGFKYGYDGVGAIYDAMNSRILNRSANAYSLVDATINLYYNTLSDISGALLFFIQNDIVDAIPAVTGRIKTLTCTGTPAEGSVGADIPLNYVDSNSGTGTGGYVYITVVDGEYIATIDSNTEGSGYEVGDELVFNGTSFAAPSVYPDNNCTLTVTELDTDIPEVPAHGGNFTGGHADNTWEITTHYIEVEV